MPIATDRCPLRLGPRAFAALLAVAPGIGVGQTPAAPSDWQCASCAFIDGWELSLDAGPAWVPDADYRYGDYTGLDSSGLNLFGNLYGRYADDDGNYAVIEGYSRGSASYGLFAEGGRQGVFAVRTSVQSIPRRFFDTTRTPFDGTGGAALTLPASWVHAPTTAGMTALSTAAMPVEIGWDRTRYGVGFDFSPHRDWELNVDYRRQERQGLAQSSASVLFSALEFASAVDYTTDDVEATFRYAKDKWQASASYFGSVFDNADAALTWDNPYSAIAGADRGRQALAPDNEAQRVSVAGSVLLPARTTLNGHLSFGRMTQDEQLLPYTINPSLAPGLLPAPSAGAAVDTASFSLRAVSSPWNRLTLEANLKYRDFDNRTPTRAYDYVVTDTLPASTPALGTAYDYRRTDASLRTEYRVARGTRLQFGVDTGRYDRDDQDRRRTQTDKLWLELASRLAGVSELKLDVFGERRDGSGYETVVDSVAPENPLMRKYNMADRDRSGWKLRGGYFGAARSDFGIEIESSDDRYGASELGVSDSDYLRLAADFSYLVSDLVSVHGSYANERFRSDQANSQSFSVPDWTATTEDRFDTATLGAAHSALFGRLDAEIELTWSDSAGKIRNDTSGLESSFPELDSSRSTVGLRLSYPYSKSLKIGFSYYYEKMRSDDWALDGVGLGAVPNLMALGASAWNYSGSTAYFSVRYELLPF